MTTFYAFTPSRLPPAPSFQPVFDGVTYTVTINNNLFGQRFYAQCADQFGNIVFNVPLVASLPSSPIEGLIWDGPSQTATMTTLEPHYFPVGASVELTVEGAFPDAFNGTFFMLSTGTMTLTFPLANDPGQMTTAGTYSYLVDMAKGYFSSSLVFRNSTFEVSP